MSDRRRFLKGLTSLWGREQPIRRPTTLIRDIAPRQAGIGCDLNRSMPLPAIRCVCSKGPVIDQKAVVERSQLGSCLQLLH
jgi:hypothetical protein